MIFGIFLSEVKMSVQNNFNNSLLKLVNTHVDDILTTISKRYDIKMNELYELINGGTSSTTTSSSTPPTKSSNIVDLIVQKSNAKGEQEKAKSTDKRTVADLKLLCKERNLPVSGTKVDLITRLQLFETSGSVPSTPTSTRKKAAAPKIPEILTNLQAQRPTLEIKKTPDGFFEHEETHLIFDDEKSQTVIGVRIESGEIVELTDDDIEKCKQYGFKYNLPTNLELNDDKNIKIEELDDDNLEQTLKEESEDEIESEIEDD